MDPLSIIADTIAIGSFTTASLKAILRIRGGSEEVQALINEISDLSAVIRDVEHTLRCSTRLNAESAGLSELITVLSDAHATTNHLHAFVSRVLIKEEGLIRNASISRLTWLKEKPQVSNYQRQLRAIRRKLTHALGIANLSTGARVQLSVESIVAISDDSKAVIQAQAANTHEPHQEIRDLRDLVHSRSTEKPVDEWIDVAPGAPLLPLHVKHTQSKAPLEGRRGLEVQLVWRPSSICDANCYCLCHEINHGRSPEVFDRFLGMLFWGYSGLPIARKRCNVATCQRKRGLSFGMSYYFPAWFVERKLELVFRSTPLSGPQLSIKLASIVSNGSLLFKYTHTADLAGIKSLFSQGLASPSDVGHLDGCTALHFAVERGNREMIDFLVKTNADPYASNTHLESPATYAWDIILGNSMDQEIIDFLRATFSDRDFLEEQNFNRAHEIVLGLNGQSLIGALEEQPLLTDSPDSRGNTPLIWAATRGDSQKVQQLLEYGADTNYRNKNGWNALYTAVNYSRLECAAVLLTHGYTDHKDGYGMTTLHRACQQTDAAYVQLLLKYDLNVDEQDVFERCPLALAAWRNNSTGVESLLDRGANKEVRDIFGATPLLRAVQYAAVDATKVLLRGGCDVLAKDYESQTILHRAALSRDLATIQLLTEQSHILYKVDVFAKDNSGMTARERLQTADPSAKLLKEFAAMALAFENAKLASQARSIVRARAKKEQGVFKDDIEYQSYASLISSCPLPDDERYRDNTPCKMKTKLGSYTKFGVDSLVFSALHSDPCFKSWNALFAEPQEDWRLNKSPRWLGRGSDALSCFAAVNLFFEDEVQWHGLIDYEFMAPGATPIVHERPEKTPRRYVQGSCVLAIVMMTDFDPDKLPTDARAPVRPEGWPKSDLCSYKELWHAAERLLTTCTSIKKHGWVTSGDLNAIGVFLWTKNSALDRRFNSQYARLQA